MTSPQPKVRLGSMETVFITLVVIVGLLAFFSLVPLVIAFIWIVIPALLTIAVVAAAVWMLWRFVRT